MTGIWQHITRLTDDYFGKDSRDIVFLTPNLTVLRQHLLCIYTFPFQWSNSQLVSNDAGNGLALIRCQVTKRFNGYT